MCDSVFVACVICVMFLTMYGTVSVCVRVVHILTNCWAIQFCHGYNPADCDVGEYRDNPATHRA